MSNTRILLAFQDFVSGSIYNANDYYFESFNPVKKTGYGLDLVMLYKLNGCYLKKKS